MMLTVKKAALVILMLANTLMLAGCKNDLKAVKTALDDTVRATALLQAVVTDGLNQQLIPPSAAKELLEYGVKVNLAAQHGLTLANSITTLQTQNKTDLGSLLTPVLEQVTFASDFVRANIDDAKLKQKLLETFFIVQAGLQTIQVIVQK